MVFKSSSFTCKLNCVAAAALTKTGFKNPDVNFLFCKSLAQASTPALTPGRPTGRQDRGRLPIPSWATGESRAPFHRGNHGVSSLLPQAPKLSSAYPRPPALISAKQTKKRISWLRVGMAHNRALNESTRETCQKKSQCVFVHQTV